MLAQLNLYIYTWINMVKANVLNPLHNYLDYLEDLLFM